MRDTTIAELREGEEAVVFGRVEPAGPAAEGPTGEPCVYWEKRGGLRAKATEQGGGRFWVVDGEDRVLVPAEEIEALSAAGDWTEEVVAMATSDIAVVAAELAELKQRLKHDADPELRRRKRKLAKVATLLCSVRAHARGKVHGKGTLEGQAAWIEKNRHLADDGPGKATISKAVSRLLVVLAPGDPVTVSGRFEKAPMPPGLGAGGGYRDRATCWVVRSATVVGHEEASADATPRSPAHRRARLREAPEDGPRREPSARTERSHFGPGMIFAVTAVAAIGALLTLLRDC